MARLMLASPGMPLLRALAHACPLLVLTLMSCTPPYQGWRCGGIARGTDPASLPLGPVGPISAESLNSPALYFNYTPELPCCMRNPTYKDEVNCSTVSCPELVSSITGAQVEGDFKGEPCGPREGVGSCTVFIKDSKVVAVHAFCAD